jgi:hypothetical protein
MLALIKLDLLKEELDCGTYTGSTRRSELLETKRGYVKSLKKASEELPRADGRLKKKLQTKLEVAEMNIERLNVELLDIWKEEIPKVGENNMEKALIICQTLIATWNSLGTKGGNI